jgi:hypothetical protein
MSPSARDAAVRLLRECGAGAIEHPGGTLLAHLIRVADVLERWSAPDDVVLAGLCHATYGTDGFPTALLPVTERARLASVVGAPAEELVHLYGSCDRGATYPLLAGEVVALRDRFTGETRDVAGAPLQAFVELTIANELDLVDQDPEFAARYGPELLALFTRARRHASDAAWRAVTERLVAS